MDKVNVLLMVGGRVLIALIFVLAGVNKIGTLENTQAYMEAFGVPGSLVYPTIVFEIGAAIAIVLGFQTRVVALALAAFCVLTALIFHSEFGDQIQSVLFMKNLAMAGGFLFLVRHGAGEPSVDNRRQDRTASAS